MYNEEGNTTLSEQFQNLIEKIVEIKGNIDTPNTHIYDRSLSWIYTGTSTKKDGVIRVVFWIRQIVGNLFVPN